MWPGRKSSYSGRPLQGLRPVRRIVTLINTSTVTIMLASASTFQYLLSILFLEDWSKVAIYDDMNNIIRRNSAYDLAAQLITR
jgi:hypothetical protein